MAGAFFTTLDFLLVCVLCGAWLHCVRGDCRDIRSIKFYPPDNGRYLDGHVFVNISIGIHRQCEERCLLERECISINIGPRFNNKFVCELSNSDHLQHPEDLKPRHGWTFRGAENLCAINPCLNSGKCLMGYTDKKYLCVCASGFTGENCETDINECSCGSHKCSEHATCVNTAGHYDCSCKPGYTGEGYVCFDIDECNNGSHDCSENATCINTAGHFDCSCKPGYTGEGYVCFDIDECNNGSHDCSENATCVNTAGHYGCSCKPGYTGDGRVCSDCSSNLHRFEKHQDLPTKAANAVEQFRIDGSVFLAFANRNDDNNSFSPDSFIYKMNDSSGKFFLFQTIATTGGRDIEYFTIADKHYIAVANIQADRNTYKLNSSIYQWDGHQFVFIQNIPTDEASGLNFFEIFPGQFLAVANTGSTKSVIYKWKGNSFEKFQDIETEKVKACTAFVINNDTFIAFANFKSSAKSTVFKWSGTEFFKLQSLQSHGAYDVKAFNTNGETFLAFANYVNGGNNNIDSFIYKWNGTSFVLFQSIPTRGARALHPFVMCRQTFLGVANYYVTSRSVIYRASGMTFIKYQEISTLASSDMTSFKYEGHTYLAVANVRNSSKRNFKSTVYKWV